MKILENDGSIITVQLPTGEKTVLNVEDQWILTAFPNWGVTGSRSKYIFVERGVATEYSTVRERLYLHRVIVHGKLMSSTKAEQVDHIDRDRFNNRRSNLRICSSRQNMANVAMKKGRRFKGVFDQSKYRKLKKPFASYVAYIDAKSRGQQKRQYLGHFTTAEEAARAYDNAARLIWGEFAFLNFPNNEARECLKEMENESKR